MKRAALSAASESRVPPFCIGWFATTPTGRPPARASPITMFLAHDGLISNQLSRSNTALMTRLTSYAERGLMGPILSRPSTRRLAGSADSTKGAASVLLDGRYDRNFRTISMHLSLIHI